MKNLIKNFITKTNEWYEKLPDLTGFIFYLSLILIPYSILVSMNIVYSFIWLVAVIAWRVSYKVINELL